MLSSTNLPSPEEVESVVLDVRLKSPHPRQRSFIYSKAKRRIVRAGRRGGKTTGVAIYAVLMFLAGRRVLYAVPTNDQVKKFWFEVTNAFANAFAADALYKNETEHIIEKRGTENRIRAKTAWNADTLRGDYADVLILDEWQLMAESAWEDVGAPMLIDNNGDAVFIYTPPTLEKAKLSKAKDPRHAQRMFEKAKADTSGRWETFHFTSLDNPYLSAQGLQEVTKDMTQASLRREIYAEDSKTIPGALWKQELIDATRVDETQVPTDLELVLVGVDPTGSSTNEAGIVCTARGPAPRGWAEDPKHVGKKHGYVLADASTLAPTPKTWAQKSVNLYFERKASYLLGERNYGGDMVESTIRSAEGGQNVAYADANATRGKVVRAEPVCAAFENGLFHIVGMMPELEDEMTSYVPGGPSPNRMDAMVWGGLRCVEGMDVYGLIEFLAQGGAEKELARAAKANGANGHGGVNPLPSAVGEKCPQCNCSTVQNVAGQKRCAECGHQWWPNGKAAAATAPASRADLAAGGKRGLI